MIHSLFVIVLLALPHITLDSERSGKDVVSLRVQHDDRDFANQCFQSGLEVRYRYSLQLCKRRPYWLDACLPARREIRRASFDPISESYQLKIDRHGDERAPVARSVSSQREALELLSSLPNLPLPFLATERKKYLKSSRRYLSSRVEITCKGEYNKTLARISYVLSLGLVNLRGFDTGWEDVYLPGGYSRRRPEE